MYTRNRVLLNFLPPVHNRLSSDLHVAGQTGVIPPSLRKHVAHVVEVGTQAWATETQQYAQIYLAKLAEHEQYRAMGLSSAGLEHAKHLCGMVRPFRAVPQG